MSLLVATAAVIGALPPLGLAALRRRRERRRQARGQCVACGYDRRNLAHDVPCPECGHAVGAADGGPTVTASSVGGT